MSIPWEEIKRRNQEQNRPNNVDQKEKVRVWVSEEENMSIRWNEEKQRPCLAQP